MSCPQLKAELRSLQRAHAEATSRAQNPTHNDDMDEALELLDQLKQRQDEIDALRNELSKAKHSVAAEETDTQYDADATSRPATPEFTEYAICCAK
jgi:hypothetical protein